MTPPHSPGAVLIETGIDTGLAWHYGDALREQVVDDASVVDLSNRDVIRITGSDRVKYLDLLASQNLQALAPGQAGSTFFLNPSGQIMFFLALLVDPVSETIWGWTEPGQGHKLVDYLNGRKLRLQVFAEVCEDLAVVWSRSNPRFDLFRQSTPNCLGGYEQFIPRSQLSDVMAAGRPVGLWAYTARRIAAGIPRFGPDTDERCLPNELGVPSPEVAIDKGCYPGQETVARIHYTGVPTRRLVRLHLDGSQEPSFFPKTPLVEKDLGTTVGFLGSMAYHYQLGPIGLGLVKHSVDNRTPLLANSVPASIEAIV